VKEETFVNTTNDKKEFIYEIRKNNIRIIIFKITNYKCTFGLTESKDTGVMQKASAKSA
jgi:hypothetical protein